MKISRPLFILSILTGLLAAVQSGAGLFWKNPGSPFPFTPLRGEAVQMSGQGLYAYDTYFKAPILRGTDAVTLFLAVPMLAVAIILARRGSLRGKILLASVLAYLLYNATSIAMGVAYNNLFLVYVALFAASLFAFILAFNAIDQQELASRVKPGMPRRGIAALMFFTAAGLTFAWLPDILGALARDGIPALASYTTEVTYVIDLGVIVPVAILSGALVLRRAPMGNLLAGLMLILLVLVGIMVTSQTVAQTLAGISLTPGEIIGKAASFVILALIAAWLLTGYLRNIAVGAQVRKKAR